jgi:hypothetical protein
MLSCHFYQDRKFDFDFWEQIHFLKSEMMFLSLSLLMLDRLIGLHRVTGSHRSAQSSDRTPIRSAPQPVILREGAYHLYVGSEKMLASKK